MFEIASVASLPRDDTVLSAFVIVSERHIAPFRPRGKPRMREWIRITRKSSADYRKDLAILQASMEFVRRLSHAKGKKDMQRTDSSRPTAKRRT